MHAITNSAVTLNNNPVVSDKPKPRSVFKFITAFIEPQAKVNASKEGTIVDATQGQFLRSAINMANPQKNTLANPFSGLRLPDNDNQPAAQQAKSDLSFKSNPKRANNIHEHWLFIKMQKQAELPFPLRMYGLNLSGKAD